MEPNISVLYLHELATGLIERDKWSPYKHISLKIRFNIILPASLFPH
jgi:hypothetical protein